jgi:hypothetical protein
MTKRIRVSVAALVVGLVLAISCSVWAGAQTRTETKTVYYRPDLKIIVDGHQTTLDVTPFIIDPGWIMIPVEFVSKELGAVVAWDDASSTFTITTKEAIAATSKGWYTVAAWRGTGTKTTETFNIKSKEWRITWESSGDGRLEIFVYDEKGSRISYISSGSGNGTSYVHEGEAGKYYLAISVSVFEGKAWYVKVEDTL